MQTIGYELCIISKPLNQNRLESGLICIDSVGGFCKISDTLSREHIIVSRSRIMSTHKSCVLCLMEASHWELNKLIGIQMQSACVATDVVVRGVMKSTCVTPTLDAH